MKCVTDTRGERELEADVLVYGATAGGIAAAVVASRAGRSVVLVERGSFLGGMVCSGLGLIDILRKNSAGGIFAELVDRTKRYYAERHGALSDETRLTYDGLWAEPHVLEHIVEDMVASETNLTLLREHELRRIEKNDERLVGSTYRDRRRNRSVFVRHTVAIDGTYEGDLAAAAGVDYRVDREGREEYGERFAGHIFYDWRANRQEVLPESTGKASPFIQASCFRVTLTSDRRLRVPFERPESYQEFMPLYRGALEDFRSGRMRRFRDVVYQVPLPNGKFDSNGNIEGLTSPNLAERNLGWAEGDWEQRERIHRQYKDYTCGLWYFLCNDPDVPWIVREEARCFGLCLDEYVRNEHFPWQLYIRQARRIRGEYTMIEGDSVAPAGRARSPIPRDAIAVCEHNFDCHPCRNRGEGSLITSDGFELLEGTMWFRNKMKSYNKPTSIPYRTIVPEKVDGLLVPVAMSASHVAFTALRMEPTWMATGQAAGVAAVHAVEQNCNVRAVDIGRLQNTLLDQGQILVYFHAAAPGIHDPGQGLDELPELDFKAVQKEALRSDVDSYEIDAVTTR